MPRFFLKRPRILRATIRRSHRRPKRGKFLPVRPCRYVTAHQSAAARSPLQKRQVVACTALSRDRRLRVDWPLYGNNQALLCRRAWTGKNPLTALTGHFRDLGNFPPSDKRVPARFGQATLALTPLPHKSGR